MRTSPPKPVRYLLGVPLMVAYIGVCSQEPAPSAGKSGEKPQAQTTQSQQDSGTEQQPLIILSREPPLAQPRNSPAVAKERGKTTNERLLTYSTVWLAAVTTILAIFTGYLWLATKRLVEGAQDTARRQLRAYVSISNAEITGVEDGCTQARLGIKNSGQTPAYDLTILGGMTIREAAVAGQNVNLWPEDGDVPFGKTTLGSGQELRHFIDGPALTPQQRAAVQSGTHGIFLYGEILYKDLFSRDRDRFTRYRLMQGGEAGVRENALVACKEGNEAS